MSFPEEPLDLSPSEGGGYFPATIPQKLNGNKYEIIRKLGYGPRSSTWLIWHAAGEAYFAVKIFTVAASERAQTVELPILKVVDGLDPSIRLPVFHGKFWEKTTAGLHLCFVLIPMSTTVQALQKSAEGERLPVHIVQKVVRTVADALEGLHGAGIVHGAIKPENICFSTATQPDVLKPILDSEPTPTTSKVKKYDAVHSQPLAHVWSSKDRKDKVADWGLYLDGFGHAQQGSCEPEKNADYSSAPETLLQNASISPETDIWMLGYMTYYLLTGASPLDPKPTTSKTIAQMSGVLEEPTDSIPPSWFNDPKVKDYAAVASGQDYVLTIATSLSDSLHDDDVAGAVAFIKDCLRLDPAKRISAEAASEHEWLKKANACSCGFCR